MNEYIERYLDGELRLDELPAEVRAEAERWSRALAEIADDEGAAPSDLEARVMAEVMAVPAHSPKPWLLRPHTIRFTPLSAGLLAAAVLAGLLLVRNPVAEGGPAAAQEVFVQFALEAPGANSVAVAGDFSAWEGEYELEDLDGDGIWTGRVLLSPGVHQYMFVIDGSDWVTDPNAERYSDDGFGNRNAVIAVESSTPLVIS